MAQRPTPSCGLGWGLFLHRYHVPADWPRLLESTVPEQHRAGARAYLEGIAYRMRVRRAARHGGPVRSGWRPEEG